MRTPLGDGWYLVTDDALLADPPDRKAIAVAYAEPDDRIRLEGPNGLVASFPFGERHGALKALGIKRKRTVIRKPPGPAPKASRDEIVRTIKFLWVTRHRRPTQEETAEELGVTTRTVAAQHAGVPWRTLVTNALRDLRWDLVNYHLRR